MWKRNAVVFKNAHLLSVSVQTQTGICSMLLFVRHVGGQHHSAVVQQAAGRRFQSARVTGMQSDRTR